MRIDNDLAFSNPQINSGETSLRWLERDGNVLVEKAHLFTNYDIQVDGMPLYILTFGVRNGERRNINSKK